MRRKKGHENLLATGKINLPNKSLNKIITIFTTLVNLVSTTKYYRIYCKFSNIAQCEYADKDDIQPLEHWKSWTSFKLV